MTAQKRNRRVVQATLSDVAREYLDTLSKSAGETRSATLERLIRRAAAEVGSVARRERLAK
jgi:hypothetical protein